MITNYPNMNTEIIQDTLINGVQKKIRDKYGARYKELKKKADSAENTNFILTVPTLAIISIFGSLFALVWWKLGTPRWLGIIIAVAAFVINVLVAVIHYQVTKKDLQAYYDFNSDLMKTIQELTIPELRWYCALQPQSLLEDEDDYWFCKNLFPFIKDIDAINQWKNKSGIENMVDFDIAGTKPHWVEMNVKINGCIYETFSLRCPNIDEFVMISQNDYSYMRKYWEKLCNRLETIELLTADEVEDALKA